MRFDYVRGEALHRVELVELGAGRWRVRWTLREAGDDSVVREERTLELEALPVGAGAYSLRVGEELRELRVEHEGSARFVVEGGETATTSLEFLDPYRPSGPAGARAGLGPVELSSPMPGRVVELPVASGERVRAGQTVVVVEAMKMANEHRSPIDGTVSAVRCVQGQAVERGAVLVVIEPEPAAGD